MAVTARRTFANVKSSAITPRQPEVPNLMGEVVLNPALVLMARYFSRSRHTEKAVIIVALMSQEKRQGKTADAKARNMRVVLVTCPSVALARQIARAVVQKRLAACVNLVRSPMESFYTWKGKLETTGEHLLLIKTTTARLRQLEREVKRLHTYDVPEFIALPVTEGSAEYLSWLELSVADV